MLDADGGSGTVTGSTMTASGGPPRLWRQIARDIETRIRSGSLALGDRLPTEAQLCERYGTKRYAVRKALAYLYEQRLIDGVQGRGTFVRRPSIRYVVGKRTRYSENIRAQNEDPSTSVLRLDVRRATREVARALGLKPADKIVFLERLALVNEQPVAVTRHHFIFERVPQFVALYTKHQSITETLMRSGIPDYIRQWTRITARTATADEAALLHMPRHVPLILTISLNCDTLERPLEYAVGSLASDRSEIFVAPEEAAILG